jgi:hypothetical protein
MQDIAPDMEELFRRASEDYPLKQGEDKWSEIASKINGNQTAQPAKKQKPGFRKYYAALLFLLMFLSLDFFFSRPVPNQNADLQKLPKNEIKQVNNHTKTNKAIDYKILEEPTYKNKSTVSKSNFNGVQPNLINRNIEQHLIITKAGIQDEKIKNLQSVNQPINFTNDFEIKVLDRSTPSVMNIKDIDPINTNNNSLSNINSSDMGSRTEQFTSSLSNSAEKKVTNKTSMRRFYYGLVLGTELNTVKNQDMKKVGFDIGLIGGYRFNRHISAETGVLFSQKYYTTAGKYFSLKEIGSTMPAAMKVMDVKGTSTVLEIPVHLRYDVFNKKDHRFFSLAGFSSYILTNESNQYHTSLNGTEGIMYGTYKTNRSYFAASFDLAIGYEKNFGKKSNIRFQPYVQLPVKGIGVGNLKVMSTGVHIAITRSSQ